MREPAPRNYDKLKYDNKTTTYQLIGLLRQLPLGLLHVVLGSPDGDLVALAALLREADEDTAALLHNGADQTALGADDGVVVMVRDVQTKFLNVRL